ncbi:hypothetical protein [Halorussus sp. AFM4]|uniref:hypothetical protein n=1 Tax=Halorussus sp. AFM4 TaxID=3421651 RepID=UPI003EB82661
MAIPRPPVKQVTLLVVAAVACFTVLLLAAMVQYAGYLGVALFAGLLVGLVALAVLAGVSLEAGFAVVAYVAGAARTAVAIVGERFGR